MGFWEFLLQKDGDRSWLPLEGTQAEILEGRYRVVARSHHTQAKVEIRITHDAIADGIPLRRIQKRSGQINPDGLVVIMPYTRLLPGEWELRCLSEVMADLLGESWQYAIQLRVLAQELDGEIDPADEPPIEPAAPQQPPTPPEPLQPDLAEPIADRHSADQSSDAAALLAPVPLEISATQRLSAQLQPQPLAAIAGTLHPLNSNGASKAAPPEPAPARPDIDRPDIDRQDSPPNEATPAPDSLILRLDREAYVVPQGQRLLLSGQIEASDAPIDQRWAGSKELCVRLSDPSTSKILVDQRLMVIGQSLPLPFSCELMLPQHHETYLLLGEVRLQVQGLGGRPIVLAAQTFSVTTDLHELLESVANDFSVSDAIAASLPDTSGESIDLAFLDLLGAPETETSRPMQFQPSSSQLPPQLHPIDPSQPPVGKTAQSIDLPTFRPPAPASPAVDLASPPTALEPLAAAPDGPAPEPAPTDAVPLAADALWDSSDFHLSDDLSEATRLSGAIAPAAPTGPSAALPGVSSETAAQARSTDAFWADDEFSFSEADFEPVPPPAPEPEASPEETAFQSLKLQNRFWERLQALASDTTLAAELSSAQPASDDRTTRSTDRALGQDADWAAQEFVVDDLPELPEAADSADPESFAALPTPEIKAPAELIAGEPAAIEIRLPDREARTYIKLWLIDRQSRALLEGPRWLMDLQPNGRGWLVSQLSLPMPQGCLEVQLEAIAVDMQTQQESHKAVLARSVMPPNLSDPELF